MSEIISAIYEHGQIHPSESLNLHEHQKNRIGIIPETPSDRSEQIIQFLTRIGLLTPPKGYSDIAPVSGEERSRLADIFAQFASKPLSEVFHFLYRCCRSLLHLRIPFRKVSAAFYTLLFILSISFSCDCPD